MFSRTSGCDRRLLEPDEQDAVIDALRDYLRRLREKALEPGDPQMRQGLRDREEMLRGILVKLEDEKGRRPS